MAEVCPAGPGRLQRVQGRPRGLPEAGDGSDVETGKRQSPQGSCTPILGGHSSWQGPFGQLSKRFSYPDTVGRRTSPLTGPLEPLYPALPVRWGPARTARTGSSVPRSLVRRPNSGMASVPWGLRARLSAEHRPLPKKPRPCLKGLGACGLSSPHLTSVWVSLNLSPPLALSPKGPGPGQRFLNEPGSGVQTRQGPDFQCSPDAQSSVATRVASEAPLLFTP